MFRVACVFLPEIPVVAATRAEPELSEKSLAITDGKTIVSGKLRGLSVPQALAVDPGLAFRPLSLEGIRSTQEALVDVGLSISPRVEDARPGLIFIDIDGTEALFPSERGLLTALEMRLQNLGLRASPRLSAGGGVGLGIAPTRTAAWVAARASGGGHVVREGEVRAFLAPCPLDLLEPEDDLCEVLSRWGIWTLGELGQIDVAHIGTRLGKRGVELVRRARGEDLAPFRPSPVRLRFEEGASLDFPVETLETLSFPLRATLDRLSRRLQVRALAVRELRVELELEDRRTYARQIEMVAPTVEPQTLLTLTRLGLERDPPGAAVSHLRVIATPGSVEAAQLDLFRPPLPAPAELAVTLSRLDALCGGSGGVGAAGVRDSHDPDPARIRRFAPKAEARTACEGARREGKDLWSRASGPPRPILALRIFRPARRVRVRERAGVLLSVELEARAPMATVMQQAGPWRLFGEWWGESCFARDYFDVELSDGGLYRLYHSLEGDGWFIDGLYD